MLRRAFPLLGKRKQMSGFYVASHPWLAQQGLLKVGFSTDLQRRLRMGNYTTCFTDEWQYECFHCCRPQEARLLEYTVLAALEKRRIPNRELILIDIKTLRDVVDKAVKLLKLKTTFCNLPQVSSSSQPADATVDPPPKVASVVKKKFELIKEDLATAVQIILNPTLVQLECDTSRSTNIAPKEEAPDADEQLREGDLEPPLSTELFSAVALRGYQKDAVQRVWRELQSGGKAIVQMACRSGKTPVAHQLLVMSSQGQETSRMLFLVPGLALLRQTACKLAAYGLPANTTLLLIGSDPSPIMLPTGDVIFMTTNLEAIEATIRAPSVVVIISTYLSSHLVQKALQSTGQSLQLSVYDEAHRVCGSAEPSAFNAMLLTPPNGNRVFLTATPTYDTPLRMDNTELFGGIAYRFYLREGISLGHINDFAVEVVLGKIDDMTSMVCKALTSVDKMLVFCKNIRHAEDLYDSVRKCTDVDHECFIAHSRLGSRGVTAALAQFRNAKRAVLFNVRLFQEGVEVPDLNAVFFAAPRYSPRDIIQSICRPLNKLDGKPQSTIFLPADFDATKPPDTPANLQRFSTLIPYTDALMDEDPTLFEYLIDPSKHNYRIKVVGVRELTTSDHDLQNVVLPSLRRGVRYSSTSVDRLHRAERLPWKLAFAELRRVVVECNRYPKINDAWIVGDARVPLHAFYRYCREGYQQHLDGVPSSLEQHQIRDLESLPSWTSYGVHGPYPWPECLATLRAYIAAHKEYPLLDIHRGGYIGLDATPFERLAGALCNINQQERQDYLAVSPEKQQDLDNLCNEFGVTWRKPRNKNGRLRAPGKSQITDCYDEFKRRFAQGDKNFLEYVEEHFPGYPLKHKFMESLAVQRGGTAPPRLKLRSESQLRRMKKRGDTDLRERVVVCRQCRVEVHASEWQQHINSEEHRKKTA